MNQNKVSPTSASKEASSSSAQPPSILRKQVSPRTESVSSSLSRTQRIQNIIDKRHPYADRLQNAQDKLTTLIGQLKTLEDQREQIHDPEAAERLSAIELANFLKTFNEASKNLDNLIRRFSRSTLNIGVIGVMGDGKSTLLQKLSKLNDEVIPTRQGGKACTAARSIICHQDTGKTYAKVTFHTKDSFLVEIIEHYYKKLRLGAIPATFDEFADNMLPQLSADASQTYKNTYKRFKEDYWSRAHDYKSLLDTVLSSVTKEEIKKYVAQDYDSEDQLTNAECLAVRQVEIFCTFSNRHVGKIALVDIPGLGDFRLGDEKLLLQTMEQDVDAVLFIRKPRKERAQWEPRDAHLYDLANSGLNNLKERCFIVLNLDHSGDNFKSCQDLERELKNRTDLPVVDRIIADCFDPQEANNKVLEQVLNHLEREITNLDKRYAQACLDRIINLLVQMKEQLGQAGKALEALTDENTRFNELFEGKDRRSGLWGEMTSSLGELLDELRQKRKIEDSNFQQQIADTIAQCQAEPGIPSQIEKIKQDQYAEGGYPDIYYTYLKEMRANLAKHFLNLDIDLQKSLEGVKTKITELLKNQGRLGELSTSQGSEFLQEIAVQLPKQDDSSSLWLGFHTIGEFNVSFAGIILRLVREQFIPLFSNTHFLWKVLNEQEIQENVFQIIGKTLSNLVQDTSRLLSDPAIQSIIVQEVQAIQPLSPEIAYGARVILPLITNILQASQPDTEYNSQDMEDQVNQVLKDFTPQPIVLDAQKVQRYLLQIHEKVLNECQTALAELAREPNQIAYFMVEEFVDQIFYAKGVDSEWKQFLWENRQKVWTEFKQAAVRRKLKEEWEDLVKQTEETNNNLRQLILSLK